MKKSDVRKILANMKVSVPVALEKELLAQYTARIADDGHEFQYTEQDAYEQMRKTLNRYEKRDATTDLL